MPTLDETHDPALRSWIASANGHPDFPIQNLPFGVFSPESGSAPRGGVAIGASLLDLPALLTSGLLTGDAALAAEAACGPTLNGLLALDPGPRAALRRRLAALLRDGAEHREKVEPCLHDAAHCTLHLPAAIGDYTDFYAGIHHATAVGRLFRPDNPLLPNYKHVPIGYHGRASSVVVSGTKVRRPSGQLPRTEGPSFGPSARLDYELELGVWVGRGNAFGEPIGIAEAHRHIAGFCLLNDWSARDLQAWEYQPLGPFLAKSFATTISPWIVTAEALAPFRAAQPPRSEGDPAPLRYLLDSHDQDKGALALELEVSLLTPGLREAGEAPHVLGRSDARHLYWTPAQLLTHHASNGCNLRPGDLLGTGTISGPRPEEAGSLLERTSGGRAPIRFPSGEERSFLDDGDEVLLSARAVRNGFVSIGFGPCRGVVVPAP